MKLEDIQELWHRDSEIDYTELGTESIRTPQIHDKYLKIFTDERIRLKELSLNYLKWFGLRLSTILVKCLKKNLNDMAGNNIWEDFSRMK